MVALSTSQLDFLFEPTAGTGVVAGGGGGGVGGVGEDEQGRSRDTRFERLLAAVAAEHVLLAAKWLVQALAPDSPELLLDDARKIEAEFARKYGAAAEAWVGGGMGAVTADVFSAGGGEAGGIGAHGLPPLLGGRVDAPRISAISPASGPFSSQSHVTLTGYGFGRAVVRGQVNLVLAPAVGAAGGAATLLGGGGSFFGGTRSIAVRAQFVSDSKLRVILPPAASAGLALLTLDLPLQAWVAPGSTGALPSPSCTPNAATAAATAFAADGAEQQSVGGGGESVPGTPLVLSETAQPPRTPRGSAVAAFAAPGVGVGLLGSGGGSGGGGGSGLSVSFRYYLQPTLSRLRPTKGGLSGGVAVRLLGTRFADTRELTVRVLLNGVQMCVPGVLYSESEVRFLTPRFADAGMARVQISLNGQHWEQGKLDFEYVHERCAIV
mmetsp:Transcript_2770/g.6719  ORF Transcript_2770/g.6719 Transcript_2770/m.6719 type:complete len:437 (+) Transcript_2770:1084-2394(+)